MPVKLPPKIPGEHRWIAAVSYSITTGQAAAAHAGSAVKLGPHNTVTQGVGCVDCEEEWPATTRCAAAAAPEMDDVTGGGDLRTELSPAELDRLYAAVGVIGRSGGKAFEVGHLEENAPAHLARWYATATFSGAKVVAEEHADPIAAAEELAWKILEGGGCIQCGKTIALEGHAGGPPGACQWRRVGDCWVPGCTVDVDVDSYIAQRRAKRKGTA